ncbi:MAG: patatin-like phospholipase family protein [Gammaproteobacteria bacterium]|nr:patatin-like phospholipase family protein [Gammaproteobacteria bacterium]
MTLNSRFRKCGLLCMLFACFLISTSSLSADADTSSQQEVPIALAISGAISLGAYEAGYNWALINILKKIKQQGFQNRNYPELKGVSGTSAGSVNALFSAMVWCMDESKLAALPGVLSNVDKQNLFEALWLKTGIRELMPENDQYEEDEFLLSRKFLNRVLELLQTHMDKDIWQDGCEVPLAFVMTRVNPDKVELKGISLSVSRVAVSFRLKTLREKGKSRAVFLSNTKNTTHPLIGRVVYPVGVRTRDGHNIPVETIVEFAKASSSVPGAFSAIHLDYCLPDENASSSGVDDPRCPAAHMQVRSGSFKDGGSFDNKPLGLASAIAEPWQYDVDTRSRYEQEGRRYNYIYMEHSNLRGEENQRQSNEHAGIVSDGLIGLAQYMVGTTASAGDQELFNLYRRGDWSANTQSAVEATLAKLESTGASFGEIDFDALFQTLSNTGLMNACRIALDNDVHSLTAYCLAFESAVLESMYRGFRVNIEPDRSPIFGNCPGYLMNSTHRISSDIVMKQRQRVICMLEKVADKLGEDSLKLRVARLNENKFSDRVLFRSDRYVPLTGSFLGHFAAFLDPYFREFDYYVGVFDALLNLSQYYCSKSGSEMQSQLLSGFEKGGRTEACTPAFFRAYFDMLGFVDVRKASFLFQRFVRLERLNTGAQQASWRWLQERGLGNCHSTLVDAFQASIDQRCKGIKAGPKRKSCETQARQDLETRVYDGLAQGNNLASHGVAIFVDTTSAATCSVDDHSDDQYRKLDLIFSALIDLDDQGNYKGAADFKPFLARLKKRGFVDDRTDSEIRTIINNSDGYVLTWYQPLLKKISDRIIDIQDREAEVLAQARRDKKKGVAGEQIVKTVDTISFLAILMGNSLAGNNKKRSWTQSTAPYANYNPMHLVLPYEANYNILSGGYEFSWEPSYRLTGQHHINLRFTPLAGRRVNGAWEPYYQASANYDFRRYSVMLGSMGAGLTFNMQRSESEWLPHGDKNVGFRVYANLLANKIRVSYGQRNFGGDWFGDDAYINVGLIDLPGTTYWAVRAGYINTRSLAKQLWRVVF